MVKKEYSWTGDKDGQYLFVFYNVWFCDIKQWQNCSALSSSSIITG